MWMKFHILMCDREATMKTIQMTIDEPLLTEVDRVSQALKTNRSEFIREALKLALQRQKILELERRHAEGYARHPVQPQEFAISESDLVWGDA
jgi:metal-responsive CopG/Arc/MetJ family transcriptional regulator